MRRRAATDVAYRRTAVRWLLTLYGLGFFVVAVSGVTNRFGDPDEAAPLVQQLIFAPIAVALGRLVIRLARRGVWASHEGLTVRNALRTYRIDWSDIAAIERPPPYGTLRNAGVQVVLRNGRTVSADLFAAGPFSRPSHSDAVVARLRSALEANGSGKGGAPTEHA